MAPSIAAPKGQRVPASNGHLNGLSHGASAAVPNRRPHSYEKTRRLSSGRIRASNLHSTSVHENTFVTRTLSGGYVLKPAKQAIEFKTEYETITKSSTPTKKNELIMSCLAATNKPTWTKFAKIIRDFKAANKLDKVIVLWTPNTERYPAIIPGATIRRATWSRLGIKPLSIASYNHLGNNDGRNLTAKKTSRSKEISKSNVVDDMGGRNKSVTSNTCQDSLLAIPLILDLVIISELPTRVQYRKPSGDGTKELAFQKLYLVLSLLSSMRSPTRQAWTNVISGAARQRAAINQFLRALLRFQPLTEWERSKIMA
ncbi:hypothetical protein PtB15_8B1 [Puccinia triticina]|nr:hypothetical protein PtB15_8B1 [Puccinia triticina]